LLMQYGRVAELPAFPTPALTMVPGTQPDPSAVDLVGEWGLLLFTDGLVEGSAGPGAVDRLGVPALVEMLQSLVAAGIPRSHLAPALLKEAELRHGGPLPDDVAVILVGTRGWWC
jgi:serine phosphatase RsbU (regulator of sigma subunit)